MDVNHFEYPDLALTVDRGKVGDPSVVTLNWMVVDDDGDERLRKLVLGCELLIDDIEGVRELSIVSVGGDSDAVADFRRYVMILNMRPDALGLEIKDDGDVDNDRMHDVAISLGRAMLLSDAKDRFPPLFLRVQP